MTNKKKDYQEPALDVIKMRSIPSLDPFSPAVDPDPDPSPGSGSTTARRHDFGD